MFDRIAGVYDRMNSVMTAGMHHRWRERAADLARAALRRPRPRRGHRHRRPGDRAGAPHGPGRGGGDGLLRGDARDRPRARRPAIALRAGQRARARLRRTTPSTPPRWGSARATSPTSPRAWPRWRAWCARAGGWWCSRSPRPSARRCRGSSGCGSTSSCPASGSLAGDPDAYTYLPSSVRRFPGPRELGGGAGRGRAHRRALGAHRRAASSPSTRARCRRAP